MVVSAISRRERSSSRSRVSPRRELEIQTSELPPLLLQMTRQSIRLWPHREWDRENKKGLVLPPCLSLPRASPSVLSFSLFFYPTVVSIDKCFRLFGIDVELSRLEFGESGSKQNYYEKRKHLRQRDFGGLSDSFRTTCAPEKLDETSPSTLSSSPRHSRRTKTNSIYAATTQARRWMEEEVGKRWIELVYYAPSVDQRRMVNNNASWNGGSLVNWIIDTNICVNTRRIDWKSRFFLWLC